MSYVLERNGRYLAVDSVARRDRFLARGWRWVDGLPKPPPLTYVQLQARAKAIGIPANQSRAALEAALR